MYNQKAKMVKDESYIFRIFSKYNFQRYGVLKIDFHLSTRYRLSTKILIFDKPYGIILYEWILRGHFPMGRKRGIK